MRQFCDREGQGAICRLTQGVDATTFEDAVRAPASGTLSERLFSSGRGCGPRDDGGEKLGGARANDHKMFMFGSVELRHEEE